jgi:hypothetical protein
MVLVFGRALINLAFRTHWQYQVRPSSDLTWPAACMSATVDREARAGQRRRTRGNASHRAPAPRGALSESGARPGEEPAAGTGNRRRRLPQPTASEHAG